MIHISEVLKDVLPPEFSQSPREDDDVRSGRRVSDSSTSGSVRISNRGDDPRMGHRKEKEVK